MSALNKDCAWCESRTLAQQIFSKSVEAYKASCGELAKEFIQRAIEHLEWIDGKRPCACEGKMKGGW